jgi:plastocyanin
MIGIRARAAMYAAIGALIVFGIAAAAPLGSPSIPADGGFAASQLPPRTGISPVSITLHAGHGIGWGYSNATTTEPGPKLKVFFGDIVNLTLIGDFRNDSSAHNWFIDYDNNSIPSGVEPSSPDFNIPGRPAVKYSFDASYPGTWTYRCRYHSSTMTGTIVVTQDPRPVNITLYGGHGIGWGFSNSTTREPGPPLVVLWSTHVTLTLIADFVNDSSPHNWFIDYNNDSQVSPAEPSSPDFNLPAKRVVVWSFNATETGSWTYRCRVHPTMMTGSILIVGGPPSQLPRGTIPLITGIMVGALAFVLIFASVYHVRAVRTAKRMR